MKWRSPRTPPSRWYTRPTGAWCAARRRTAPRAGWCWFRETLRCGGDSRGPGRAIPAIITKFARCAPESITRWRWRGFSRSGPCDSGDHYEVRAVRPGEYYAVALAGNGPVLAVDEALLNQAVKVTVRAGEAS